MLAMMLIAQITLIPAPPPAAEEALHALRTSRSLANLTDAVFVPTRETPTPRVRSPWRSGDGPFGAFDRRLTRMYSARGSYFASALESSRLYRPRTVTPIQRVQTSMRGAIRPRIPHIQPLRLSPRSRRAHTTSH